MNVNSTNKFDQHTHKFVFAGYSSMQKGYKKNFISWDVISYEEVFPFSNKSSSTKLDMLVLSLYVHDVFLSYDVQKTTKSTNFDLLPLVELDEIEHTQPILKCSKCICQSSTWLEIIIIRKPSYCLLTHLSFESQCLEKGTILYVNIFVIVKTQFKH